MLRPTTLTLPKLSLLMWCDMSNFFVGKGTRSCTCMLPCWKDLPGAKWKFPATCLEHAKSAKCTQYNDAAAMLCHV